VFGEIGACALRDEWMLLQEFREDVDVDKRRLSGHQAADSRKNRRRSKASFSMCAI